MLETCQIRTGNGARRRIACGNDIPLLAVPVNNPVKMLCAPRPLRMDVRKMTGDGDAPQLLSKKLDVFAGYELP
jgi:hypothetical protein